MIFQIFYDTLRDDSCQSGIMRMSSLQTSTELTVTPSLVSYQQCHNEFLLKLNWLFPPQDGRLRSGDHILRIGDTDLYGMGSEQVAQVLRQCGNKVKLVVTRGPVDETPSVSAIMPVVLPTVNEHQVRGSCFTLNYNRNIIYILTMTKCYTFKLISWFAASL